MSGYRGLSGREWADAGKQRPMSADRLAALRDYYDSEPVNGSGDVVELIEEVDRLLALVEQQEKALEAARALHEYSWNDMQTYDPCKDCAVGMVSAIDGPTYDENEKRIMALGAALAALSGGSDE